MNFERVSLAPGLYLVATPIGSIRDITLRALDVLASADLIAAEDTRTARKLMTLHGIPVEGRKVVAYHDHSSAGDRARIVDAVMGGKSVAYVSEAGTPLIADPGYQLVRDLAEAGGTVTAVPGPSAVLSALNVSGLPTDRFLFVGFLPSTDAARRTALAELRAVAATVVIYESPKRIADLLTAMCETMGNERKAVITRELTKRFEETIRGTLGELQQVVRDRELKGEIVVVLEGGGNDAPEADDVEAALRDALGSMKMKDAATAVAGVFGLPRRDVYQMALKMRENES